MMVEDFEADLDFEMHGDDSEQTGQACAVIAPTEASRRECEHFFRPILNFIPCGWICGGSLRDYFSRTPCTSDIDVFFPSARAMGMCTRHISKSKEFKKIYDTEFTRGYMFKGQHVQLIKGHYQPTVAETILQFDFTVCCAGITHDGTVVTHPQFFEDLAARRLSINNVTTPLGTLARVPRYVEKGFKPDNASLVKLAKAIKEADFDDPQVNRLEFYRDGRRRKGRIEE